MGLTIACWRTTVDLITGSHRHIQKNQNGTSFSPLVIVYRRGPAIHFSKNSPLSFRRRAELAEARGVGGEVGSPRPLRRHQHQRNEHDHTQQIPQKIAQIVHFGLHSPIEKPLRSSGSRPMGQAGGRVARRAYRDPPVPVSYALKYFFKISICERDQAI